MPGLDQSVLDKLDFQEAINRINFDQRTDFIWAPHYVAIYGNAHADLIDRVSGDLRAGRFEPQLPISIEVPKRSGLSRPGTILSPADRLIYQALADVIAPVLESQLDRTRVFSNVLQVHDAEHHMFEPHDTAYAKLHEVVQQQCRSGKYSHAIKADVANFFERMYQHNLVNLMLASGCQTEPVSLLEKLFLAWMDKNSHGIPQGMLPSDLFGNFYLVGLDTSYAIRDVPSARFVDDIYLFLPSLQVARETLVELCALLRKEGLNLNEWKSSIKEAASLLEEETELDRLFDQARQEVRQISALGDGGSYGAVDVLTFGLNEAANAGDAELPQEQVEVNALVRLYEERKNQRPYVSDQIVQFCLPKFGRLGIDAALDDTAQALQSEPHLTRTYCLYLSALLKDDPEVAAPLESAFLTPSTHSDYQLLWPAVGLIASNSCSSHAVAQAARVMKNLGRSEAVRAICAVLVGRHGNAAQRHLLKQHYQDEPSPYVRSALLYSARYVPKPERDTCLMSWGGHSATNALIAKAVKKLA